jgi:hypothetical protein
MESSTTVKMKPAFLGRNLMVDFVRVSKDGTLLEIREVPDKYRTKPYDELAEK